MAAARRQIDVVDAVGGEVGHRVPGTRAACIRKPAVPGRRARGSPGLRARRRGFLRSRRPGVRRPRAGSTANRPPTAAERAAGRSARWLIPEPGLRPVAREVGHPVVPGSRLANDGLGVDVGRFTAGRPLPGRERGGEPAAKIDSIRRAERRQGAARVRCLGLTDPDDAPRRVQQPHERLLVAGRERIPRQPAPRTSRPARDATGAGRTVFAARSASALRPPRRQTARGEARGDRPRSSTAPRSATRAVQWKNVMPLDASYSDCHVAIEQVSTSRIRSGRSRLMSARLLQRKGRPATARRRPDRPQVAPARAREQREGGNIRNPGAAANSKCWRSVAV